MNYDEKNQHCEGISKKLDGSVAGIEKVEYNQRIAGYDFITSHGRNPEEKYEKQKYKKQK